MNRSFTAGGKKRPFATVCGGGGFSPESIRIYRRSRRHGQVNSELTGGVPGLATAMRPDRQAAGGGTETSAAGGGARRRGC